MRIIADDILKALRALLGRGYRDSKVSQQINFVIKKKTHVLMNKRKQKFAEVFYALSGVD